DAVEDDLPGGRGVQRGRGAAAAAAPLARPAERGRRAQHDAVTDHAVVDLVDRVGLPAGGEQPPYRADRGGETVTLVGHSGLLVCRCSPGARALVGVSDGGPRRPRTPTAGCV